MKEGRKGGKMKRRSRSGREKKKQCAIYNNRSRS